MHLFFNNHKTFGSILSGAAALTGTQLSWTSWHIPPIVMECLQSGAWVVAIAAGALTIISKRKKNG